MKNGKPALLLAFIAASLTLNSCSKDKQDPSATNTLSATIDGTSITFNQVIAVKGIVDGKTFTSVEGIVNKDTLSITLPGTITAGKTYTSTAANDDDKPLLLYSGKDDDYFNDDDDPTKVVTVSITSASGNTYQGTFKGNLTNTIVIGGGGSGTAKHKVVTDGKFSFKTN